MNHKEWVVSNLNILVNTKAALSECFVFFFDPAVDNVKIVNTIVPVNCPICDSRMFSRLTHMHYSRY